MTVSDLISELQRLPPHIPVRVLMESIEGEDEGGPYCYIPGDAFALEATYVEWRGYDALIFGGGMAHGGND